MGRALLGAAVGDSAIIAEMQRAEKELMGLVDESLSSVSMSKMTAKDAALLGRIVSKLSPLVGNLLEAEIVNFLASSAGRGLEWRRQDPEFPDAGLFRRQSGTLEAGFEIKAWYVPSTEITARFRESSNLLAGRDIRVVIVAWMMSEVIFGSPEILGVLIVPASQLALARDRHYHQPPRYIILEPGDTAHRTRNLQQSTVNGYRWQSTDTADLSEALRRVDSAKRAPEDPHGIEEQELARELQSKYSYRLDTNFAKIDRIDDPDVERFKTEMLERVAHGRKLRLWTELIRNLESSNTEKREQAEAAIAALYI